MRPGPDAPTPAVARASTQAASRSDRYPHQASRTTRENAYVEIRTQLEDGQKVHAKKDEKFKSLVDAEVARLKNAIVIESHAREREDDELADAMNLYIDKLQGSLKTVNSDAIE